MKKFITAVICFILTIPLFTYCTIPMLETMEGTPDYQITKAELFQAVNYFKANQRLVQDSLIPYYGKEETIEIIDGTLCYIDSISISNSNKPKEK
jgi:predicted Abi (CAAX) family protease